MTTTPWPAGLNPLDMTPGPSLIVKLLLREHPLTAPPERLVVVIADLIVRQGWEIHRTFALERAERWEPQTRKQLRAKTNELEQVGRPARLTFNSSDADRVQGWCYVEPGDSESVKEQKAKRSQYAAYHDIIKTLTPDEFEQLCRRTIELLGVRSANVTRKSGDDGIDFYGRIDGESVFFPNDLQPTVQRQLSIWLVGQAKQYLETQAGTPEVRDLVGAVMLGRTGAFSTEESPFPDLDLRVCDPVFSLLVTGGTLSARAWKLLHRSGVVGIDGELLAAFLADRQAGPGENPNAAAFKTWLSTGR